MATTQHSKKYSMLKSYYWMGLWTIRMMRCAVVKKWITAEEFKEITGEDYETANTTTAAESESEG
ncbi:XkdX family protein [Selenomonas ruminantium]|uniref:Phage uncharacterized protein (Phage_XkdX) n=1 Tax=Selenomonas ruminantium TaxID=971 RepID=A0A1H0P8E3_SELRU|nr:XkdX family protein [Selenomonas ruminantium]SDP01254.1 Phage uncharacterised protein (Phage_XkdX) [Selenomonas ruminantium]